MLLWLFSNAWYVARGEYNANRRLVASRAKALPLSQLQCSTFPRQYNLLLYRFNEIFDEVLVDPICFMNNVSWILCEVLGIRICQDHKAISFYLHS